MTKYQRLNKKFYQDNTFSLAHKLLGKYLIRQIGKNKLVTKIVETEAYYGFKDKASHAAKGKTERTKIMFAQSGTAYIYQIYGLYFCLNIVTEAKDFPAAILIRALEPVEGIKQMYNNRKFKAESCNLKSEIRNLTNGPSKLCQALKIDKTLNNENLITSKRLYLAAKTEEIIKPNQIQSAKRIGIDYAGTYKHKPWRYYLKNNPFVSTK